MDKDYFNIDITGPVVGTFWSGMKQIPWMAESKCYQTVKFGSQINYVTPNISTTIVYQLDVVYKEDIVFMEWHSLLQCSRQVMYSRNDGKSLTTISHSLRGDLDLNNGCKFLKTIEQL